MESVPVTTISESPTRVENISALEESVPEAAMTVTLEEGFDDIEQEDEDGHEDITSQYEEEVAKAKLKLIIRSTSSCKLILGLCYFLFNFSFLKSSQIMEAVVFTSK